MMERGTLVEVLHCPHRLHKRLAPFACRILRMVGHKCRDKASWT